jgi:MoaA/NifB/PqqE/SkfB family radical SAM enzyme
MEKRIVLMVNSECNSGCKHCYISYKSYREPENVLKLVDIFSDRGYKVITGGSEILLNQNYLKAYERAGQKYLLTNGILLSKHPEIPEQLRKYGIDEVRISLHFGIQEELGSVPEKVAEKAIENAKKSKMKTKIFTTVTKRNYKNVSDMCKKAYDLGVNGIKFIRYIDTGNGKQKFLTVDEAARKEFFNLIESARKQYGKEELEIEIHGNFGPREGSKGEELSKKNEYCPAGLDFFIIDPEDNIYGCPFLMQFPIGKLLDGEILIDRNLSEGKRDRCLTDYLF